MPRNVLNHPGHVIPRVISKVSTNSNMSLRSTFICIILSLSACSTGQDPIPLLEKQRAVEITADLATAHGISQFKALDIIQAKLVLDWPDQKRLHGTLLLSTDCKRSELALSDGTYLGFNGQQLWMLTDNLQSSISAFHARTWPLLLCLPFRGLQNDERAIGLESTVWSGKKLNLLQLTLAPEISDNISDWLILLQDASTGRLSALAFQLTYGGIVKEQKQTLQALTIDSYHLLEGALLPGELTLRSWSFRHGPHGKATGKIIFSDYIRFKKEIKNLGAPPPSALILNE